MPEKTYFEKTTYRPLIDYGGWGIRYGRKGTAYTVSGNQGIQIVFNTSRKLILGSQMPDAFEDAIQSAIHSTDQ